MKTQERTKKYGITERKKTDLDALAIQIIETQQEVAQYQAIVASLTAQSDSIQVSLVTAADHKTQAYNNKIMVNQLVQSAVDLENNSEIAFNEVVLASTKTKDLAAHVSVLIKKLIYAADVIHKLANLVIRKKALNPLISDELVNMISTAGREANRAVAITLVALKTTFAAQTPSMESETGLTLEYTQSVVFCKLLTGAVHPGSEKSLAGLFNQALVDAGKSYVLLEKASVMITKQLNMAITSLNTAEVKLQSLQSGFAAATAAALAY